MTEKMVDQSLGRNSKIFGTLSFLSKNPSSYLLVIGLKTSSHPKYALPPNTTCTSLLCDIAMHILWFTDSAANSLCAKSPFKVQLTSYVFWDIVSSCNTQNELLSLLGSHKPLNLY